jgi:HEAT repeat protein
MIEIKAVIGVISLLAILVLPVLGQEQVNDIDSLIKALTDNNSSVRSHAASSLGDLKDPRAVEPLIQTLKDNDSLVRMYAAEALGKINDTRAVEPLIQTLKDNDTIIQQEASEALKKLGWPEDP